MSVIVYALFLLAFGSLAMFSIFYRNLVTQQPLTVKVDTHTMLVASFFLYSSSLPVSRLLFGSIGHEFDMVLMRMHLYGFMGFMLGSVFALPFSSKWSKKYYYRPLIVIRDYYRSAGLRTNVFATLIVVLASRYFWLLFEALGFNISNILQPYGFEAIEGGAQTNLADVFVYFGLYASLVFGIIWDLRVRRLPSVLRIVVYTLVIVLVCFWLLRGSRNMVALLTLPIVSGVFYRRQLRAFVAVISCLFVVTGFYVLAGVRSVGFTNVSQSDVVHVIASLDPLNGELGTSYSVLDRSLGIGISSELLLGKSYVVDPLLNLVPRSWWPNRPDNLAVMFSKRYFNTDQLSEGLGFSPVVEAYLNFGEFGIVGVFAVFYFLLVFLEERHRIGDIRYVLLIAFALPNILNWNRIDMSTAFKMYSGYVLMSFLLPKLFIRSDRHYKQ